MSSDLLDALTALEEQKGISRDVLIEAIEAALVTAYKRNFNQAQNVRVDLNLDTGSMIVYSRKDVVEEVEDDRLQISLEDAKMINPVYEVGDVLEQEVTPRNFGRIAAQTAKQVVTQRVREAERGRIYEEYVDSIDDIMVGTIERQDQRNIYVSLGKVEAALPVNEQIQGELYKPQSKIRVYITKVERTTKGPQIIVSRTHPGLLRRLFEMEVPEMMHGKSLNEMNFSRKFDITVSLVLRNGEPILSHFADLKLQPGDDFLLIGSNANIDKFKKKYK